MPTKEDWRTWDRHQWEDWWRSDRSPFGRRPGGINWLGPNLWTAFALVLAFAVAAFPARKTYLWFLTQEQFYGMLSYLAALLTQRVARSYEAAMAKFEPTSQLEAKRANEQIKLSATLLNGAAGASVTVFALSELLRPAPDYIRLVLAVSLAIWVHTAARRLLGLLKDEAISKPVTG